MDGEFLLINISRLFYKISSRTEVIRKIRGGNIIRSLLVFVVFAILLIGCSSEKGYPLNHPLLSDDENAYLLYVVVKGEYEHERDWLDWLQENNIVKVKTVITEGPLEEVNE